MTPTLSTYLLVLPLVFLAAVVDAIAGGGGLISLPAYTVAGLNYDYASGNNKFSSTFGTLMATLRYARSGAVKPVPAAIAAFSSSLAIDSSLMIWGELKQKSHACALCAHAYACHARTIMI